MNKEIEEKLNELIDLIKNQEEIKNFKKIESKMLENEYLNSRIEAYKKMQQRVVLYESKNDDLPKEVSEELDSLYNELFEIPIYNEYTNLQNEINDLFQHITFILETEINA